MDHICISKSTRCSRSVDLSGYVLCTDALNCRHCQEGKWTAVVGVYLEVTFSKELLTAVPLGAFGLKAKPSLYPEVLEPKPKSSLSRKGGPLWVRNTPLLVLLLLLVEGPKVSLVSRLDLPLSDVRRSGGALLPLLAAAGR